MTVDGARVRVAREELGWSRPQLAERLPSVSVSQLAAIELGNREPTEVEEAELREVLLEQLGLVLQESGEVPVVLVEPQAEPPPTWDGLQRGDRVRVSGMRGTFRFQSYHPEGEQPYVNVYGPPTKPKMRSVVPERVKRLFRRRG